MLQSGSLGAMMRTATQETDDMKAQKTTPVRLTDEAIKWARIASGYTGESMAEYVSRIVAAHAKTDADRLHAEAVATTQPAASAPKKGRKAAAE